MDTTKYVVFVLNPVGRVPVVENWTGVPTGGRFDPVMFAEPLVKPAAKFCAAEEVLAASCKVVDVPGIKYKGDDPLLTTRKQSPTANFDPVMVMLLAVYTCSPSVALLTDVLVVWGTFR